MDVARQRQLREESKKGSMGALVEYVNWMLLESREKYEKCTADHRFYQSRVNTLDEIVGLLPDTSK